MCIADEAGDLCPYPARMDQRSAGLDQDTVSNPVCLYGEFSLAANPKVRCAVSLTQSDLTVQRLTWPAGVDGG